MADDTDALEEGQEDQEDQAQSDAADHADAQAESTPAQPSQGIATAPTSMAPAKPTGTFDMSTARAVPTGITPSDADTTAPVTLSDYGKAAWTSTISMGEDALGAAQMVARKLGASDAIVKHIEDAKKSMADSIDSWTASMSPGAQQALHASIFGGTDDNGEHIPTPGEVGWGRYIGLNAAEFVPSAIIATATQAIAAKLGLGVMGAMIGTGGAFGTIQMGGAFNQLVKDVDKAAPEDFAPDSTFRTMLQQGYTVTEAKQYVINHASTQLGAVQFALGAVGGAGMGGMMAGGLPKSMLAGIGKTLLGRMGLSAGAGAADMMTMTGGGEVASEAQSQSVGLTQGFDASKVATALASGALQGIAMGGPMGALHGGAERNPIQDTVPDHTTEETQTPGKTTGMADPAVVAALTPTTNPDTAAHEAMYNLPPVEQGGGTDAGTPGTIRSGRSPATPGADDRAAGGGPGPGTATVPPGRAPTDLGGVASPQAGAGATASQDAVSGRSNVTTSANSTDTLAALDIQEPPTPSKPEAPTTVAEPAAPETPAAAPQTEDGYHPAAVEAAARPDATPLDKEAAKVEVPSEAQAEAGNYQKGHVKMGGLDISIETPRGGTRTGIGPDGKPWSAVMPDHYGYIKKTAGADGDHIDVTIGPHAEQADQHPVYVIDQKDPATGKFDEHKAMLGYDGPINAMKAYDGSFSDGSGPGRRGAVNAMSWSEFEKWAKDGDTSKAISYKPTVSELMRAKRAAQKAAMAPPGARMRGEVATVEPTQEVAERAAEPSDEGKALIPAESAVETLAKVRTGLDRFKQDIVPLRTGGDITKVMNQVVAELSARFKDAKTSGDVLEALAKWGTSDPSPLPGTRTRRVQLSDRLLMLLTNKDTREFSGRGADVRQELAEEPPQPLAYEKETNREDITEGETPTVAHAVEELETKTPPEPNRPIKLLPWLLDRVQDGDLTVAEAAAKYDTGSPTGRPRGISSFSDYLDKRIADALDPATKAALEKRLTQLEKRPTSQGKSEETKAINRMLENTGEAAADKLRALKAELDPVHEAVAQIEGPATQGERAANAAAGHGLIQRLKTLLPQVDKWAGENGYAKDFGTKTLAFDERTIERLSAEHVNGDNTQLDRTLDRMSSFRSDRYDWTDKVPEMGKWVVDAHRWLETMDDTNNPEQKARMAALEAPKLTAADKLRALKAERDAGKRFGAPTGEARARALSTPSVNKTVDDMLRSGLPHTSGDYLEAIKNDPNVPVEYRSLADRLSSLVKDVPINNVAADKYASGEFVQGRERGTGTITIAADDPRGSVETILHETIHSVASHYIQDLTKDHPDMFALEAMRKELANAVNAHTGELSTDELHDVMYALRNVHEMHTMLLTSPPLQRLAAMHTPTPEFKNAMRVVGYGLDAVKNVWQAFTKYLARALGMGSDVRASNLLDHIMRPLQDITDRAAQYNRQGPGQQFGRKFNAPTGRDVLDKARDVLPDPATLGNSARKGLLVAATSDGIVDRYDKLFTKADGSNPLRDVRTAYEAEAARTKGYWDKYADRVAAWTKSVAGPNRDKLAKLIIDATTADVKLGPNANNAHITTTEGQAKLEDLQGRFNALNPKDRATYIESARMQAEMGVDKRNANLDGVTKGLMPDATKAQVQALRDVVGDKGKLEAFLKDPDNSGIARTFGADWTEGMKTITKSVAKVFHQGWVSGDYFPLNRDGEFVLHYGTPGEEDYGVERFTTIAAAEARRAELAKQSTDGLSTVQSLHDSKIRDTTISAPAIDEIARAMDRRGDDTTAINSMRDLLGAVVMQHANSSAGARAKLRRQGVLGASTDIEKIASRNVLSDAARVGYMANRVDRMQALDRMQQHTDELGKTSGPNQRAAQAVTHEMQARVPSSDEGESVLTKLMGKANQFGYIMSLRSFSHMITSTAESHSNSIPLLAGRHGIGAATVRLSKALKDSSPILATGLKNTIKAWTSGLKAADWNLSTVVRDRMVANGADRGHMVALFNSLNAAGLIDHTFVKELQRIADPGHLAKVAGWSGRLNDMTAAGAHAVDVANKSAIAKAAFDLELAKNGGDVKGAVNYATDIARRAMPNYNSGNKSRISGANGPLGRLAAPIMQFKQYGIHQYSMMSALVKQGDKESLKAFAGIMAAHMLLAGVIAGSSIGDVLRWGGGALDLLSGAKQPHDYENNVRNVLAGWFGPEAAELIARGAPHLAGIDIHRRVGLSNLLEPPELKSFDQAGMAGALAQAVTGASGEDVTAVGAGISQLLQGNIVKGIQGLLPRDMRDLVKAYGLATTGVTDSQGRPIKQVSGGDVVRQALGFQPSSVTEFRERRFAMQEAQQEEQQQHASIVKQWVQADPADRADLVDHIRAFNQAHPGAAITHSVLLQALKRQADERKSVNSGMAGLTVSRKMRGEVSGAGAFANGQ